MPYQNLIRFGLVVTVAWFASQACFPIYRTPVPRPVEPSPTPSPAPTTAASPAPR